MRISITSLQSHEHPFISVQIEDHECLSLSVLFLIFPWAYKRKLITLFLDCSCITKDDENYLIVLFLVIYRDYRSISIGWFLINKSVLTDVKIESKKKVNSERYVNHVFRKYY